MAHMEKDITAKQRGWRVEVGGDTWYVPGDVVDVPDWLRSGRVIARAPDESMLDMWAFERLSACVRSYVGPGEITEVEVVEGYFGRYSAPGYLDCTDWQFDKTLRGIREALND